MDDRNDYISWWLYDASDYIVEEADCSRQWDLREPAALYDYLAEQVGTGGRN